MSYNKRVIKFTIKSIIITYNNTPYNNPRRFLSDVRQMGLYSLLNRLQCFSNVHANYGCLNTNDHSIFIAQSSYH